MKKILILLVAAGVVGTVGIVALQKSNSDELPEDREVRSEAMVEESLTEMEGDHEKEMFMGTVAELMAKGSVVCDFSSANTGGTVSGTVWVDKDRMRGDFVMSQINGTSFDGSVIRDGEYAWTWGGPTGGSQGVKLKLNVDDVNEVDKSPAGYDPDETASYECEKWDTDESKFTPPADVNFVDIGVAVQEVRTEAGNMAGIKCSACDQIPDSGAQEQCRQALGC